MRRRRGMDLTQTMTHRRPSKRRKGAYPISRRKFVVPSLTVYCYTESRITLCAHYLKIPSLFVFFQLQRRMKNAELKQICARPDVVEVACLLLYYIFIIIALESFCLTLVDFASYCIYPPRIALPKTADGCIMYLEVRTKVSPEMCLTM